MFLFSKLPDNKLMLNDTRNYFDVYKIYNIPFELNKIIERLQLFSQCITIFYGVKIR